MNQNNWQSIWKKRGVTNASGLSIGDLICLDGYDTGAARINAEDWLSYAAKLVSHLNIQDSNSVFEVGCGAGAFLAAISQQKKISIGGIDYAEGLINNARQALPNGNFSIGNAANLAPLPKYDFVISNGVFHYFSLADAARILQRMLNKASLGVAILDIPDSRTQTECEAVRRAALPEAEYEQKYAGLGHTYYDRFWFSDQIASGGWKCETIDGFIPNYGQNRFRFAALFQRVAP